MSTVKTTYVNALLADASYTYVNALLADASYVAFLDKFNQPLSINKIRSNLAASLTQIQADFLLANFEALTQTLSASEGFDAVVWRGKSGTNYAGQVYVSMRGTQGVQDIADDVSLATRGLPYEQVRDMVNWWMRITPSPVKQSSKSSWTALSHPR